MALAGNPSASNSPGTTTPTSSKTGVSQNGWVDANGDYTIDGLVGLAAAASYVANPTSTGEVSTVLNFYGLGGKEKSYRWDPVTAGAIAMAESSGDPTIINNESEATGLWQIEPVNWHGKTLADMQEAQTNADVAVQVYESQGWDAWTTYKTGAYLQFMPAAKASFEGKNVASDKAINNAGQSSLGASSQVGQWLSDLGITISWKEIGVLFLGGVALIMGIYMLVKGNSR